MCEESSDPTTWVSDDINVTKAMAYLKQLNEQNPDVHITMTHLVAHALALGLHEIRQHVGYLLLGQFSSAEQIGLTCLVNLNEGKDLAPVTLFDAHNLTVAEYARQCTAHVERVKAKKDSDHNQRNSVARQIPTFFLQWVITIASYLTMNMGLSLAPLGLRKNTLGQCIMTNIGSLKI